MTYRPTRTEWFIFKKCDNCRVWRLKWQIKKQKLFVKQINQVITSQRAICGKCAKVVENAVKERNI